MNDQGGSTGTRFDPAMRQDEGFDIRRYWQVVWKHKWGIGVLTVLAGVIGVLYALSLPHMYQSTATLLIEREGRQVVSIQEALGFSGLAWEYYQTQYEIIRSRPLAEKVVNRLGLYSAQAEGAVEQQDKTWRDWLSPRNWLPESWVGTRPPPSEEDRYNAAVNGVLGALNVAPIPQSQLVNITFSGTNAAHVTLMANTLADVYIENSLEARLEMTQKAASWLTARLDDLRQKVETSEQTLQAFLDREGRIATAGTREPAIAELEQISTDLVDARRDRADAELLSEQIRNMGADPARLETLPVLLQHPLVTGAKQAEIDAQRKVSELSKRYGPKHPGMISAHVELDAARQHMRQQIQKVIEGIASEYQLAVSRERGLQAQLNGANERVRGMSRQDYELAALQREVETNRQLYDHFLTRFKETSAVSGGDVQSVNARVMQPAVVPGTPYAPNRTRTVQMFLFFGLALGVGLAFLLDYLDNTLKSTEDVEEKLALPVLGMLPRLKTSGKKDRSPLRHVAEHSKSGFSEAIRTVRTGVLLSSLDNPHKVILVTSSVPGEGKTTLATNLAYSMGQMAKVLLVEADLRRPVVDSVLDRKDHRGLSHFIADQAKASDCVVPIEGSNLYIMPSGLIPPNPLELLSSKRFAEGIQKLSERFDHIVIDCAPALAVSDALVLSTYASGVVYVVRSDATPYQAAQAGVKRLRQAGAHIIGVVLNRTGSRKAYGYYGRYGNYSDDYYADYGYSS